MDDTLELIDRVAEPGDVVDVEPVFELTPAAEAYLAEHGACA